MICVCCVLCGSVLVVCWLAPVGYALVGVVRRGVCCGVVYVGYSLQCMV